MTTKTTSKKELSIIESLKNELDFLNEHIKQLETELVKEDLQYKVGVAQYALMCNQLEAMHPYRDLVEARLKLLK